MPEYPCDMAPKAKPMLHVRRGPGDDRYLTDPAIVGHLVLRNDHHEERVVEMRGGDAGMEWGV